MADRSARTSITTSEYQQLLGLATLARHHMDALYEIERGLLAIVKEVDTHEDTPMDVGGGGFVSDLLWQSEISPEADVRVLLDRLGLTVDPPDPLPPLPEVEQLAESLRTVIAAATTPTSGMDRIESPVNRLAGIAEEARITLEGLGLPVERT